jgi:hypothetical protein
MNIKKKIILFVFFCLLVRFLIVLIAKTINKNSLPLMGYIALLPAIGFLVNYFTNIRKRGAFNQKIWWGYMRPVHSLLYFTFSYLAITKSESAYIPLLLDAILGLVAFIHNNFLRLYTMVK